MAIKSLKKYLKEDASIQNELLMIEVRLRQADFSQIRGTLADEEVQKQYLRIQADLLLLIDLLSEFDVELEKEPPQDGPKQGHVLYQIPGYMGVEKEEICKVRIALEELILREGIKEEQPIVVQQIRIADVMQVNLLDPQEDPAFSIRTFSELVQFIDEDTFTEWTFYVKPLKEGQHTLLLKVAVIELISGRERKREIVLEEKITVRAKAVRQKGGPVFKQADQVISMVSGTIIETLPATEAGATPPPHVSQQLDQMLTEVPPNDSRVSGRFPIPSTEGQVPPPNPIPPQENDRMPIPASESRKPKPWVWPMVAMLLVLIVGTWTFLSTPKYNPINPPNPPDSSLFDGEEDSLKIDSVHVDSVRMDSVTSDTLPNPQEAS